MPAAARVHAHLRGRIQDTEPIQAGILLLLAATAAGKLFIVGDPKQAITAFAGQTSRRTGACATSSAWGRTFGDDRYHSVPSIQRFVKNAAFGRHMVENRQTLRRAVRLKTGTRPASASSHCRCRSRRAEGFGLEGVGKSHQSLPDAIGAFIA